MMAIYKDYWAKIGINVTIKVIRPQDMPLQVANGNFDLAITGRDWVNEHLYQFPSSPVRELLNLGYGRVRVVAVVSQDWPDDTRRLRELAAARGGAAAGSLGICQYS
jgi:ATP phosphoribosyltransferase